MSSLVLKGQSWAPTDCIECSGLSSSQKDEHLTSFEKRKKEATSQALIVRFSWAFLHAFTICTLFLVDSDLSWAWAHPHPTYLALYLLLAIVNLALYLNLCISNPGYLQPGVHALSLATMKRDTEGSLAAEEAAELGIGGLAHIDIPLIGRRSGQRDRAGAGSIAGTLDRTTTLPNLPSQFTKEALIDVSSPHRSWAASPSATQDRSFDGVAGGTNLPPLSPLETAEAAINEAKTESAAGILAPGDRAFHKGISGELLSPTAVQVNRVRIRGSSYGGEQDFHSSFYSEWQDREGGDASEPLLRASERRTEEASSGRPSTSGAEEEGGLKRKPSKPLTPPDSRRRRERTLSWWEGPNPGRWCEYCGAWQLLRSRHCHDCGRCVRRFDHHCAWVGRCIGQDNHLMFWWYLVTQLMLLSWTAHVIVTAFQAPAAFNMDRLVVLLLCALPTFLLTAFVVMLLAYHTFLVITAQTTYELVQGGDTGGGGAKVPYLRHLPTGTKPFSQGCLQNIQHFCCSGSSTTYQMPTDSSRHSGNLGFARTTNRTFGDA